MRIRSTLVILLVLLAACGATQRERTIKATLVAVNQARDVFFTFDRVTQSAIVAAAPTYDRGAAALASYRKVREPVVESFAVAYRAIATAATVKDDLSLAGMLIAARQIADAVHALKQGEYAP